MASDPDPVRVVISQPADGADGLNAANVVISGSTNIDYAVARKLVARDVFGREFPGSFKQKPDGASWSAIFTDLPTDKWLVVYAEFQRPGADDIGSGVISIRCRDRMSSGVVATPARPPARKKIKAAKRKPAKKSSRRH